MRRPEIQDLNEYNNDKTHHVLIFKINFIITDRMQSVQNRNTLQYIIMRGFTGKLLDTHTQKQVDLFNENLILLATILPYFLNLLNPSFSYILSPKNV